MDEATKQSLNEFREQVHPDKLEDYDEMVKGLVESKFEGELGHVNLSWFTKRPLTDTECQEAADYLNDKWFNGKKEE